MATGFITDEGILEEKASDTDYLGILSSVEALNKKLNTISESKIIGIIGAFGVGKSTLINEVKKLRKTQSAYNEEWVHFDAWQFPERKELWEGLILETAKSQGRLAPILNEIGGKQHDDVKTLINTLGDIPIPGLAVIKNLNHFVETSPATRVFQLQDIFASLINEIVADKVVFIIEDIDRSGQDGLFFLETFRQFISKADLKKQVIVIVAVSNDSYNKNIDTYLKCLDYVEFFNKKSDVSLKTFVDNIFSGDSENEILLIFSFLQYVYLKYPDMNLRKIKLVLRQANLNYMQFFDLGYEPNKLICIAVVMSKYIIRNPKPDQPNESYFDFFIKHLGIERGNEIHALIYETSKENGTSITDRDGKLFSYSNPIVFTHRDSPMNIKSYPSKPYYFDNFVSSAEGVTQKLGLVDFYFKDL